MVIDIEVGCIELAVIKYYKYQILIEELAQILTVTLIVKTFHIVVEPQIASSQRTSAMRLQSDTQHIVLREDVTTCTTSLHIYLAEVLVEYQLLDLRLLLFFQGHLDDLGLTVCISSEVSDARLRGSHRHVVLTVTAQGRNIEAFHEGDAALSVLVAYVIDGACVVLLEYGHMDDFRLPLLVLCLFCFAHKHFLCHFRHLIRTVFIEDDDVVKVATVADKLIFLQACSDESVGTVDVELLIRLSYRCCLNRIKVTYLCQARMLVSVFLLQVLEPLGCYLYKVCQIAGDVFQFLFDFGNQFVGLVLIELKDALHLDFQQTEQVVTYDLPHKVLLERFQSLIDILEGSIGVLCILEWFTFIDAFLDEYLFQRTEVQLLQEFVATDFQLTLDQALGVIDRTAQHIAHRKELRQMLVDNAAVRADADFAIREGIEGIDGLITRYARHQVYEYLHVCRGVVVHLSCLYLSLIDCFQDRVNQGCRRLAERYLTDDEGLLVHLLYLCTHPHHSASLPVVVFRHINRTSCQEVWVELERLVVQIAHSSITQFVEVMRQYLGRETYSNTFGSLCQQQRELHRQGNRLLIASVVRHLPFCSLGVEYRLVGKFRQAGFNISGCCGIIAREDVTPVSLTVNQQFLLSQLHQCVLDRCIAVRMELHGVTHDVRHLTLL